MSDTECKTCGEIIVTMTNRRQRCSADLPTMRLTTRTRVNGGLVLGLPPVIVLVGRF